MALYKSCTRQERVNEVMTPSAVPIALKAAGLIQLAPSRKGQIFRQHTNNLRSKNLFTTQIFTKLGLRKWPKVLSQTLEEMAVTAKCWPEQQLEPLVPPKPHKLHRLEWECWIVQVHNTSKAVFISKTQRTQCDPKLSAFQKSRHVLRVWPGKLCSEVRVRLWPHPFNAADLSFIRSTNVGTHQWQESRLKADHYLWNKWV